MLSRLRILAGLPSRTYGQTPCENNLFETVEITHVETG
jgi:hypothetical protein